MPINYFFKVVVPQLLDYFESNAKDIPNLLLLDVLLNNKKYEKDVQEVIDLSKEISKKKRKISNIFLPIPTISGS